MSAPVVDEDRLDDPAGIAAVDADGMLRAVATAGAQVRRAATAAAEVDLSDVTGSGRPRAVVVAGMGGSGVSGDVLAAVAGPGSSVPVVTYRGYGLPAWVGVADVVVPVSCSGRTEETLSAAEAAVRRGCRVLCVGAAGSPLADLATQARAPFVPVQQVLAPRATLWSLATPLLAAAGQLGLLSLTPEVVEAAAARLDSLAEACQPGRETFVNPAKGLALELAGSLPLVWGAGPLAGVAAYRLSCQLAENAKYPCLHGELPEADHNQVVALEGPLAAAAETDLFRDRVDDVASLRLRLVLLRDLDEHPKVAARAAASRALAEERGVAVTELTAQGGSPLERLASLVGLLDFASVYLAVLYGIDPTPVASIDELKARIG